MADHSSVLDSFVALAPADKLLRDLLAVSLTGVIVYAPIYDAAGQLTDFSFVYLNPAAQRMMQMPEQPTLTHTQQWPHSIAHGALAFHIEAFVSGEPRHYEVNYQADGYDNYYRLAARRSGQFLLVSFTDTADQPRTAVEVALRESQAREQAARAEAEAQRAELQSVFEQAPVAIAILRGPDFLIELANSRMGQIWGRPLAQLLGRPHFDALPDLADLGVEQVFADILRTGELRIFQELPVTIAQASRPYEGYFNIVYQPAYDRQGQITGVIVSAVEVTEQVRAHQQVQQLNQVLELRVEERTKQLQAALHETEQQRQQLWQQQDRLEQIMGQVPAAIATLIGPQHRYTFFNEAYFVLSGGRAQLGVPMAEVFPETVAQGFMDLLDDVFASGKAYTGIETMVQLLEPATGRMEPHFIDFIYQPLADAAGHTRGILIFAVDVTEKVVARRRTEALQTELLAVAQREAQKREYFYRIFEQTPALIALLRGPGHRFEYVNHAYQQLFPQRTLVGLSLSDALPEVREQGFQALMERVYQTGETYYGQELPFDWSPDGQALRTAYFNFTYQAYQEDGQTAGISVFAYNVTEQVLARQERDMQRQRLEQLFMQAPAAICILAGPELVYELVNPGYQALFPGRNLLGRPIGEVFPELAGTGVLETFQRVYQTGAPNEEKGILIPFISPVSGELEDRYFNYIQQARFDMHGQPDGVLVFAFEITEQVQARQHAVALAAELTTANQQLVRTNVDLDTFIYTASHDLKAPITNIEGLLTTLRDELPRPELTNGEVPHILDLMQDSVERFKHTIEHLTDISKLQRQYSQPTHPVPLAPIIEGVRLDLAPLLQATGGQLDVDVRAVPTLMMSEKNLRSVIFNLLSNALKYRHPARPPYVQVRAHATGDYAVLEVQDNGLGIDLAREPQLFAMFQRLHTHVEGSGVGLYMVKRLVENAGGRITVASAVGEGSTFAVQLPR